MNQIINHHVIIQITKDCEGKDMTEKEMKKWVEDHFKGCNYGKVKVTASEKTYEVEGSRS